ncbi:hypothetical protein TNIN_9141 [Trichonephila inaurata madagascariensis]|uniref:Uncharacterized protein n=1 Tax=Trichonephila inaurata madagascariensis TaxID=2747483 RepID=A0A8X6JQ43_9ARAC|nr:hypothetical protein TNIN_9141 [Trichonephila inaurata madagascariensis]
MEKSDHHLLDKSTLQQQGLQQPEQSQRNGRSDHHLPRQSRHSRQQGLQQPEQSQRNGRSDHHLPRQSRHSDNKVSNSRAESEEWKIPIIPLLDKVDTPEKQGLQQPEKSQRNGRSDHHLPKKVDTPDNKVSNSRSSQRNGRSDHHLPRQSRHSRQQRSPTAGAESEEWKIRSSPFPRQSRHSDNKVSNSRSRVQRERKIRSSPSQTKSTLQTTRSPTAGAESEEWKIRSSPS